MEVLDSPNSTTFSLHFYMRRLEVRARRCGPARETHDKGSVRRCRTPYSLDWKTWHSQYTHKENMSHGQKYVEDLTAHFAVSPAGGGVLSFEMLAMLMLGPLHCSRRTRGEMSFLTREIGPEEATAFHKVGRMLQGREALSYQTKHKMPKHHSRILER